MISLGKLYRKVHAVLEIHMLLPGTNQITITPWPGLWQVHTHYGILHVNASLLPMVGRRMDIQRRKKTAVPVSVKQRP